ncbi:MAG: lysylphosphatidylglycerol synthase transmembrane domain-containing protein [Terracidiphilus sp.]
MKKTQWIVGFIALIALVALVLWARTRVHFDFHIFAAQLSQADWRLIVLALLCIYGGFAFRAFRWSQLVRHTQHVPPLSLVGSQVIGFTAVALIGRVADPVRPYLVAKKTGLPLSTQVAVYIVERLLDAGSVALIFSIAMFWVPGDAILNVTAHAGALANLAQHHRTLALFVARYGGLVLTLLGTLFLFAIRIAGGPVAAFFEHSFGFVSKNLGQSIAHKIRAFHSGLDTMRSLRDFAVVAGLSLSMWMLISFAYFETCRAFTASPELAGITVPKCVLLMVASGTASVIQLPVIGWFSQIGLVVVALTGILGAKAEAATACAATLLLVTFLGVVPVGLIWAQFDNVSLRKVTAESEEAEEELVANEEAGTAL